MSLTVPSCKSLAATLKDDKHRLQRMIDNLLNYCSKFIQLTELDKEAIELNFKPIKLKRKDFLLKEGMVCDFVAFLNSGVIRQISPYQYQKRKRLELAKLDLMGSTEILTTAIHYGFPDAPTFTKAFKQQFGLTPGSLRKSNF